MKTFIFVCFLSITAVCDARERKIPNRVLKYMLIVGLFCNAVFLNSLIDVIKVCGCSFLIGLFFYRMRVLGAGDVKLMAICGLYVPFSSMLVMWYVALLITGVGGLILMKTSEGLVRRIYTAYSYLYMIVEHKKIIPYAYGIGSGKENIFPFGYSVLISVLWLLLVKGVV